MGLVVEVYLFLITICVAFWWWRTANKNGHFYKNIPGPPTVPLLGNALDLKDGTAAILDTFMEYTKKYGGLVKVRVGPGVKFFVISDYKLFEFILGTTQVLNKSEEYAFLHPWLGSGLLTSEASKWKIHRKILVPAFHFQILEQYMDAFETGGNKLVEKLEKELDSSSVDVYPYITLCALDIICESIMGIRINSQDGGTLDYVQGVRDMTRILVERSISITEVNDFLYLFSKNYRTQRKALRVLHEKSNSVVSQRRDELLGSQEPKIKDTEDDGTYGKNKKPFLDVLLEAKINGEPLSQEAIREEVDTFMFEGHDTTTSALSFTIYCLANNPEVQQKTFDEQKNIFAGDFTRRVTHADLQNMKYLELVIKETLRLYPSVPYIGRQTATDVIYENTILPRDDTFFIFIYGMHRNPDYFPNPDKFDPSRFESMDGSRPYAYVPFSAGPRNCIGQKFAMLELKSIISKLLRNFEFLPAVPHHQVKLIAETVLKSSNGIKIKLKKRLEHST